MDRGHSDAVVAHAPSRLTRLHDLCTSCDSSDLYPACGWAESRHRFDATLVGASYKSVALEVGPG
jgi:hypothetical protein